MFRRFLVAAALGATCSPLLAQNAIGFDQLDAYGTLHAGGVVAGIGGDANRNASARLEWRRQGDPAFRAGHPLVRVDATHFVGSLFWLDAGTNYEVRVTLSDPDGTGATPSRTATFATRAEAGVFTPARTLYVAPNGDDGRDGSSPAQAVKTIQRGANLARAGDLVSIAAGVYRESVRVPTSGSATQPIVFRGVPGAMLDGADAAIAAGANWNDAGGGAWSRATGFATAHVVTDQGRLYRYSNLTELRALAAGAPGGFVFDGTTLSLKFSDGSAPAQRQIQVARLNEGFNLAGRNYVRIENLEIRHYGADPYGKGVYLRYSSDCTVSGNRIHGIDMAGVWIKGGERNLIERNDISDSSIANWPWGMSKGSGAENDAILFSDDVGRGNVIRRNTIHGTFNGIGSCGNASPPGFTNETDIYENTFRDHADDATETEGHCANVRLWNNRISDSLMAFAIAPAGVGPVWILRNLAYDIGNTRSGLQDGQVASGIKINSGYSTPVGPAFVYHNTFLTTAPATDAIWLMPPGYSSGLVSRNNVYAGTDRAFVKDNPIALDLDYDALAAGGATLAWWQGAHYANLAALQAGTGQETHGIEAAPALVDPAQGDFTPGEASPLIDRGLVLPGINDGYGGAAPDIGAIERNDPVFSDGFD